MKYLQKIRDVLENAKVQNWAMGIAVFVLIMVIFVVSPWATDGYENITSREQLNQRIATAVVNHENQVLIDYFGEDYANLKSWLGDEFHYPVLSNYADEFSIYNYDGAKFTYWTYNDKKRVKITISYKLDGNQISAVDSYAENVINNNGLRGMNQYEQIKAVHDYLINNFAYNVNEYNIYNMIQNGQANCYGYTMMNYMILNKLGIEVRTTYGKMNLAHIWNAVRLDGQWYYVDVTWDTVSKGTDYFLISTAKLQQSHQIIGNFIPDCPSDYVYTGQETEGNTETDNVTIVETPIEENTEKPVETVTGKTDVPDGEGEADAIQAADKQTEQTEKTEDDSFRDDKETTPATPAPPTTPPAPNKTEKLQKLSKLLKALKALKNK